MAEIPAGKSLLPPGGWIAVRTGSAVVATVSAVPYALFVLSVPLSLIAPRVVADVGLSSATELPRVISAATCGLLVAALVAAEAVGRGLPAHIPLLGGLVLLAAAALVSRSVGSLAALALVRAAQGVGAGAVLVAALVLATTFSGRLGTLLAGGWTVAVLVATAASPWATYRLAFSVVGDWRGVLAPYPWLLAVALVGTAALVVASLGTNSSGEGHKDTVDGYAGRLCRPLLLPAGIAVVSYLVAPSLGSTGARVTLYSLLLGTVLVLVTLAGALLARRGGWRWGAALPVAALTGVVLAVVGTDAFSAALFAGVSGGWPLATSHVLPAFGGAALAGAAASIGGLTCAPGARRPLACAGLVLAAVGVVCGLPTGVLPTAVGAILVWAGVGLALGAVVRVDGGISAAWAAAGFVLASGMAAAHQKVLRTDLTTRAVPTSGGADQLDFLRTGFVDAHRIWVVISAVLLLAGATLVFGFGRAGRDTGPHQVVDSGEGGGTGDHTDGAQDADTSDSGAEPADDAEQAPAPEAVREVTVPAESD